MKSVGARIFHPVFHPTLPDPAELIKDSAGVLETLPLAGGTLEDAALTNVTITHLSGSSEAVDLAPDILEGKRGCCLKLQPGDMVLVPEEMSRVAVLGYVNEPGFYPLRRRRFTQPRNQGRGRCLCSPAG